MTPEKGEVLERGVTDGPNVRRDGKVLQTKDPCWSSDFDQHPMRT